MRISFLGDIKSIKTAYDMVTTANKSITKGIYVLERDKICRKQDWLK